MGKRLAAFFLILLVLLLSACDYHELDNTVFTAGVGVQLTEDGEYQICLEIIAMEKENQENYKPQLAVATGKTLLEAASNVRGLIAQKLDFTHCKIILLDEAMAKEGIEDLVDTMFLYNDIDISTLCMITSGCTPVEALSTEALTTRAQAFELRSAIVDEMGVEKATRSSLLWLYNSIHDPEGLAVLPRVVKRKIGTKDVIDIDGGVVVSGGRSQGEFDRQEMLFFLLGEDSPRDHMISIPSGDGYYSIEIEKSSSRIDVAVIQGMVEVSIRVKTTISFIGGQDESATLDEVSAQISAHLIQGIHRVLEKARDEMDSDLFKIAMKLYRKYPDTFEDASGWRESVRSARYDIQADIQVKTDDIIKRGR